MPDLQGVWDTGTATPLTRPAPFATKSHFTPEEAAAFERDNETRILSVFSPEDRLASDLNDIYQETVSLKVTDDLRTSLIIDPPNGQLPEQLPAAKARADARPKRTFDDPETLTLDERCLMGVNYSSSSATPPLVPNPFGQNLYQIVQTPDRIVIHSELMHEARVIRINGTHLPSSMRQWAGDSIGHWEGTTLVVESMDSPFTLNDVGEPGAKGHASFSFADLPRGLAWAKSWTEQRLVVRVNPELPVELDAAGASVKISGIEGGAKLRVIAAALKLERVRGPLDLDVLSSSVKGFAAPTGTSRIACESASVKLLLGAGSDVRITSRNRLGKVVLPTAVSKGGLVDPDVTEAVVGAGRGTLTIDAVMSSVMLTRDDA